MARRSVATVGRLCQTLPRLRVMTRPAYLVAGRNLWAPVLTHGISDTIAIFVVFMGWAK